jgi:hypothetical protein
MDNSKRELVKKIKANESLSDTEKNKKIQELMMGNFANTQPKSNESKTCHHYEKSCYKFYFDCCKIYDPCKRCHAERNCLSSDKLVVTSITCLICEKEQDPSSHCIGCDTKFSNSYCKSCQIWTEKDITHCVKCGLCRLGKPESLYHCVDCGICFNVKVPIENNSLSEYSEPIDHLEQFKKTHQCVCLGKKSQNISFGYKDGICVVCLENIFNSQSESIILDCGHFTHTNCFNQYIQSGMYKCPHCKKSMGNLNTHWDFIREQIKLHPLPNDFLPIELGDTVDSDYGKFLVKSSEMVNGIRMYSGEFVDWNICSNKNSHVNSNIKKASGTLDSNTVIKNIYKNIHCNDCQTNSIAKFHFYGLECGNCKSFNTQE